MDFDDLLDFDTTALLIAVIVTFLLGMAMFGNALVIVEGGYDSIGFGMKLIILVVGFFMFYFVTLMVLNK